MLYAYIYIYIYMRIRMYVYEYTKGTDSWLTMELVVVPKADDLAQGYGQTSLMANHPSRKKNFKNENKNLML